MVYYYSNYDCSKKHNDFAYRTCDVIHHVLEFIIRINTIFRVQNYLTKCQCYLTKCQCYLTKCQCCLTKCQCCDISICENINAKYIYIMVISSTTRQIVKLSPTARLKLVDVANFHNVKNILFYVKGGGCNGFNYIFEPMYELPHKTQEIVPCDNNVNVVVCNKSILHLIGTHVHWKKDIMGETFHFDNPNAVSECGCGTSFSI